MLQPTYRELLELYNIIREQKNCHLTHNTFIISFTIPSEVGNNIFMQKCTACNNADIDTSVNSLLLNKRQ